MRTWWKLAIAVLVGAAVAIPATVIARGTSISGDADRFTVESITGQVQTQGQGYTPLGIQVPDNGLPVSATVSAQLTKGKAQFRLVSTAGIAQPSSVLFTSKASNSFTFAAEDSCPPLQLEWKRKGDSPAVAEDISMVAVYDLGTCF
jgi:hypothetical protein